MSREADGLTILTFLGKQNSFTRLLYGHQFVVECGICHIPITETILYNSMVLNECQERTFTFSAITSVRKRSLHNNNLQNKRSNLILNLVLLIMKILQVKNAVEKVRNQNLIVISMQKKKSFFPLKKRDSKQKLDRVKLNCLLSVQYFVS